MEKYQKHLTLLKIILIGIVLSVGFQYALALTRPPQSLIGGPDIVNASINLNKSIIQGKFKIGGDWLPSTDKDYAYEQSHSLVINGSILSTGLRLYEYPATLTGGNFYVSGDLSSSASLSGTGTAEICSDANGKLKRC